MKVALRKESVDRNQTFPPTWTLTAQSLSARRAWIEILFRGCYTWIDGVALRKESVDRNMKNRRNKTLLIVSLSARRAWIEILLSTT